jgi:spermidine synthase
MLAWVRLDSASMPDGGELRLMRRGTEFSIMAGTIELMNSRLSSSEEALATLACAKIAGRAGARILIGGLGMGFTLRATLDAVAADATIVVAELVPAVIAWAQGPLTPVFGASLSDSRVELREADVGSLIGSGASGYDAILLDVDNGPEGLTRPANDRLYSMAGLRTAHAALRPGGVLGVWSSEPNPAFARRLEGSGFAVEEIKVRAHRGRGARHVIWLATKRPSRALPRR